MNNCFVWIVPDDPQKAFKKRGISSHYIVPKGAMNGFENLLVGAAGIWLVTGGNYDLVCAYLKPKKVEKFLDGINENDYLLTVDFKNSFKIINL